MQIKDLPSTSSVASTDVLAKETSGGTTNKVAISDFVINNLTSTSTTQALSAAAGKLLNDTYGSITTQTNTVYLRDGGASETVIATGTETHKVCGKIHQVDILINLPSITIASYGIITNVQYAKFYCPVFISLSGSDYFMAVGQVGSGNCILRSSNLSSTTNPHFTTQSSGRLVIHQTYVE